MMNLNIVCLLFEKFEAYNNEPILHTALIRPYATLNSRNIIYMLVNTALFYFKIGKELFNPFIQN